MGDRIGVTELRESAVNGHEQVTCYLMEECSADVNVADIQERTALREAS
jgi:hypothetical protein